jgi:hypothetical protein
MARRRVRPQATATSGRAWRTEKAASRFAVRPASREERPSRRPLQKGVAAISGVSSETARKLASAPTAAAIPKERTASMRATASDAKPIAVTMLVRPQAAPIRCTAPDEAASGSSPRRTLRRMSSMKWIESQVPTTSASEGTTLVSTVTGAPSRPSAPRAQTAPTNGGTQATTVDRRLRATAAERTTASERPIELNISMSRRRACIACSRRAGSPVSSIASGPCRRRPSRRGPPRCGPRPPTTAGVPPRSASAVNCTSSERRGGVGGEQVSGHERVAGGARLGLGPCLGVERLGTPGDHRQDRAGRTLPADVEDAPHLLHALEAAEATGEGFQGGERLRVEDVAGAGRGPHDAVAVGRAEDCRHLVHEGKLAARITDQRPKIVVEPQPGDAQHRHGGHRRGHEPAGSMPGTTCRPGGGLGGQPSVRSSIRWRSAGSTIHPRHPWAPQRHGIAASAGQQ